MNDVIRVNDESAGRAILALAGGSFFDPRNEQVISRHIDGKFVGGVVYNRYRGASCEMHTAAVRPRWINRDGLWMVFHYPFVQLGVSKLIAPASSGNTVACRFIEHVGFTEESRIKSAHSDGDLVLYTMSKDDCRWLQV